MIVKTNTGEQVDLSRPENVRAGMVLLHEPSGQRVTLIRPYEAACGVIASAPGAWECNPGGVLFDPQRSARDRDFRFVGCDPAHATRADCERFGIAPGVDAGAHGFARTRDGFAVDLRRQAPRGAVYTIATGTGSRWTLCKAQPFTERMHFVGLNQHEAPPEDVERLCCGEYGPDQVDSANRTTWVPRCTLAIGHDGDHEALASGVKWAASSRPRCGRRAQPGEALADMHTGERRETTGTEVCAASVHGPGPCFDIDSGPMGSFFSPDAARIDEIAKARAKGGATPERREQFNAATSAMFDRADAWVQDAFAAAMATEHAAKQARVHHGVPAAPVEAKSGGALLAAAGAPLDLAAAQHRLDAEAKRAPVHEVRTDEDARRLYGPAFDGVVSEVERRGGRVVAFPIGAPPQAVLTVGSGLDAVSIAVEMTPLPPRHHPMGRETIARPREVRARARFSAAPPGGLLAALERGEPCMLTERGEPSKVFACEWSVASLPDARDVVELTLRLQDFAGRAVDLERVEAEARMALARDPQPLTITGVPSESAPALFGRIDPRAEIRFCDADADGASRTLATLRDDRTFSCACGSTDPTTHKDGCELPWRYRAAVFSTATVIGTWEDVVAAVQRTLLGASCVALLAWCRRLWDATPEGQRAAREAALVALVRDVPEGLDPVGWRAAVLALREDDPVIFDGNIKHVGGALATLLRSFVRTGVAPTTFFPAAVFAAYRRALAPHRAPAPERKGATWRERGELLPVDDGRDE